MKRKNTHGGARPGAGRPKQDEPKLKGGSLYLSVNTWGRIDLIAEQIGLTRSQSAELVFARGIAAIDDDASRRSVDSRTSG